MKVALDTDVLAYAEGVNDAEKRDIILDLMSRLSPEATVIPVQALGELFNVLVRKAGRPRAEVRDVLQGWRDSYRIVPTAPEVMLVAADLATDHLFSIWDAVIFAAASHAGCRLLISEDLQDGFTWGGVTVVNPFASPHHVLLDAALDGTGE